jgi:hypothetical protein
VVDVVTEEKKPVSREEFDAVVTSVEGQCVAITDLLINQLDMWFMNCEIMEALGVVFPQY